MPRVGFKPTIPLSKWSMFMSSRGRFKDMTLSRTLNRKSLPPHTTNENDDVRDRCGVHHSYLNVRHRILEYSIHRWKAKLMARKSVDYALPINFWLEAGDDSGLSLFIKHSVRKATCRAVNTFVKRGQTIAFSN